MTFPQSKSALFGLVLVSAVVVAACGSSASSAPGGGSGQPTGNGGAASGTPAGGLPAAGGGFCEVKMAGDVSFTWRDEQDLSSVLVTYWLGPSERAVLSMPDGEESFLFNCQGEPGQLSVMSVGDTTAAQFPKGPGTYVIAKAGILGGGEDGQASILLTIGKDVFWRVAEPGTLNVTRLDGSKFAGNLQVKVQQVGDDLKTVVASATLTATFEFGCTGKGCG